MSDHSNAPDSQSPATTSRKSSQRSMLKWAMAWAASMVGSAAAIAFLIPESRQILIWIIALTPIVISVGAVRSYVSFIRKIDELAIKIELESTAAGYGAGIAFSLAYISLEPAGAPELWFSSTALAMFAVKAYVQLTAARKYR